jgi:transcription elongation factor Elf1
VASELSITPHAGGFGRCHLCGQESLHRAMVSIAGRRKTVLLCDECKQKVIDDVPTLSRVLEILNRT